MIFRPDPTIYYNSNLGSGPNPMSSDWPQSVPLLRRHRLVSFFRVTSGRTCRSHFNCFGVLGALAGKQKQRFQVTNIHCFERFFSRRAQVLHLSCALRRWQTNHPNKGTFHLQFAPGNLICQKQGEVKSDTQ